MKIHEYQAKEILRRFNVPTLQGVLATTPAEAEDAAKKLGTPIVVVKAQIHAGGRGKGGGIKLAKSPAEAKTHAAALLGHKLVTPQTGAEGKVVGKVYVEAGCEIAKEYYLGMLLDRSAGRLVVMASSEGGVEIEEVAAKSPEKILKVWVDPTVGIQPYQARQLAYGLGMSKDVAGTFAKFVVGLYRAYVGSDATMAEINPLVVTKQGEVIALDCKLNIDDNAMHRQRTLAEYRDPTEETEAERTAQDVGINYVSLDGNIGCMVNGAGLAMATMDIIKLKGGDPANFLDVGGGANEEQVTNAFRLLVSDPSVKAILVNIFGGIVKCDVIASGIIAAARKLHMKVPLVVRLQGTNVEQGKKLLAESGLTIISADTMSDAAAKAVEAAR